MLITLFWSCIKSFYTDPLASTGNAMVIPLGQTTSLLSDLSNHSTLKITVTSTKPDDKRLLDWTYSVFRGMKELNRTLYRGCNTLMRLLENMITHISTREGKTNVAMIIIPNIMGHHRRVRSGDDKENPINNTYGYNLRSFKIVYIALLNPDTGSLQKYLLVA